MLQQMKTWWHSWRADQTDRVDATMWRYLMWAVIVYFVAMIIVGMFASAAPDSFSPDKEFAQRYPDREEVVGAATTMSVIVQAETLLDKRWGLMSNDITPPGIWLDNMPSWEFGLVVEIRDISKAMREQFSRSQSQSTEDKDLVKAEPRFNNDHQSWMFPKAETKYSEAIGYLESYLSRLSDQQEHQAQFYARADNLNYYLQTVGTRLGSYSQRLAASVDRTRLNTDLSGDASARQSTSSSSIVNVKTPWLEIDNVFYEARGYSWGLLHTLKAIEHDFGDVLDKKRARASLRQIIRELEGTQQSLHSPMVLNGSGYGVLANHSLVMSNYISRANASLIDLRDLLSNG